MPRETHADSQRKVPRDDSRAGCPAQPDANGVWQVAEYVAARALLRSADTRQTGFGATEAGKLPGKMRPPVLWQDGPEHREARRQTARFFTPRRVDEKYRELMNAFADEQCERLRRSGRADLSDLSFALAVAVAGEVIGLTPARWGMARRLEWFFTEHQAESGWGSPAAIYRSLFTNAALAAFFLADVRPAIERRRRQRQDDLISHLLDQGCHSGEIFGECLTFAAAGMATTREFITVAAWHLFSDEDLRATYLGGDDAARSTILNELLRLEPVVGHLSRRTTAEIELPGADGPTTIPAGASVDIMIAAANLDPAAVGRQPSQVCPGRSLADGVADAGLAFGDGPHRCPGAHIAIQETDIFLQKLFSMPGLRMIQPPHTRIRALISSYELAGLIVTVDR